MSTAQLIPNLTSTGWTAGRNRCGTRLMSKGDTNGWATVPIYGPSRMRGPALPVKLTDWKRAEGARIGVDWLIVILAPAAAVEVLAATLAGFYLSPINASSKGLQLFPLSHHPSLIA
jgi:hypothetical protein